MYSLILTAFLDNSGLIGGVIRATSSNVTIIGSTYEYNVAFQGGVIQLDNNAQLIANNTNFLYNYAVSTGGVVNVLTTSVFYIDSCSFTYN